MTRETPEGVVVNEIDITPTWGEWGNIYRNFAETGERKVVKELRADHAKAFASAEALKQIQKELPEELKKKVSQILVEELRKQGY